MSSIPQITSELSGGTVVGKLVAFQVAIRGTFSFK